ncbi:MAG: SH3 domain-containing protein [Spirochaetota bacterium]
MKIIFFFLTLILLTCQEPIEEEVVVKPKRYWYIQKPSVSLREEADISSEKVGVLRKGYKVGEIDRLPETVMISQRKSQWVQVVYKNGLGITFTGWILDDSLAKDLTKLFHNGIPVNEKFCYQFTAKTFPTRFEGGCLGNCGYQGGEDIPLHKRTLGQNSFPVPGILKKNGKAFLYDHTSERISSRYTGKWYKIHGAIVLEIPYDPDSDCYESTGEDLEGEKYKNCVKTHPKRNRKTVYTIALGKKEKPYQVKITHLNGKSKYFLAKEFWQSLTCIKPL